MKAAIEPKYSMKFGTTYVSLTQETYPRNKPPKNTAKTTVKSTFAEKFIILLAVKILQNNEPMNKNIPSIMNENIKADKLVLSFILPKKPLFSTSNLVPHSEQKSPSYTTVPHFGHIFSDITNPLINQ